MDGTVKKAKRKFLGGLVLNLIFVLFLLTFGVGSIIGGSKIIRQRSFDLHWRSSRNVGWVGNESTGTTHYRDADAVRMGIGFISFGSMLSICSIGAFRTVISRSNTSPSSKKVASPVMLLGLASFLALACASFSFFPIWTRSGLVFWSVVLFWTLVSWRLRRENGKVKSKRLFPIFICVIVIASFFANDVMTAMACGFFAFVFGIGHLLVLFPEFDKETTDKSSDEQTP